MKSDENTLFSFTSKNSVFFFRLAANGQEFSGHKKGNSKNVFVSSKHSLVCVSLKFNVPVQCNIVRCATSE